MNDGLSHKQLTTVVFTDAVGYSALASHDEDAAMAAMQRDIDLMTGVFDRFDGRIVKNTGDGLLVVFNSATNAVQSCLDAQKMLAENTSDHIPHFLHRMGIHLGDVHFTANDVLGDGVNVAARLQSEAPDGGIALSRTVYDVVSGKVRLPAVCIGPRQLKNITKPVEVWHVMPDLHGEPTGLGPVRTSTGSIKRWWWLAAIPIGIGGVWLAGRGSAANPGTPINLSVAGISVIPFDEIPEGEPLIIAFSGLTSDQIEKAVDVRVDGKRLSCRRGRGSGIYEYVLGKSGHLFAQLRVIFQGQDLLSKGYKIAVIPKNLEAIASTDPPEGGKGPIIKATIPQRHIDIGTAGTPNYLVGNYRGGSLNDRFQRPEQLKQKLVDFALKYKGTPYQWGGNSVTHGIDCSHFVEQALKEIAGIERPAPCMIQETYGTIVHRGSSDYAIRGSDRVDLRKVPQSLDELWPGDRLIFQVASTTSNSIQRHEGIYIGPYQQYAHAYIASQGVGGVGIYDLTPGKLSIYAYAVTDWYLGE